VPLVLVDYGRHMDLRIIRRDLVPAAAITCILSLLATIPPARADLRFLSSPATPEGSVVVVATLHLVDTRGRDIELITGTGLALRLIRVKVHPACEITVSGTSATIEALKEGRVVWVQYRSEADRMVATKIATLKVDPGRTTP